MPSSLFYSLFKALKTEFPLQQCRQVSHGMMINLCCGAKITVYNNGNVLVQGTISGHCYKKVARSLEKILPVHTVWQINRS